MEIWLHVLCHCLKGVCCDRELKSNLNSPFWHALVKQSTCTCKYKEHVQVHAAAKQPVAKLWEGTCTCKFKEHVHVQV